MIDSELLDSTIWIDYLIDGGFKDKIEQDTTFNLSSISLFEIKKKLLKNPLLTPSQINEKINFIKNKSLIISVDEKIAETASEISLKYSLVAADALIYSTAILNDSILLTLDNDFRGLPKVNVL